MRACRNADAIFYLGSGPEMLGFAAAETARRLRVPFIVEPAIHPGQWGDSWIDEQLYERADRILSHSNYEAGVLAALGVDNRRIVVVNHGVDLRSDGDGTRFRNRYGLTGPIVLFLGRKTIAKGVRRAVAAFQDVLLRHPETTLVMVGPSANKETNLTGNRILDLDNLTEDEKQDVLSACDILCVPSEGESFGMVYFEAWAYANPVIALDLPALRETIGSCGGGILVSNAAEELSAAIDLLLSDSSLRQIMGERGRQFAEQHRWSNATVSYRNAVNELLPRR